MKTSAMYWMSVVGVLVVTVYNVSSTRGGWPGKNVTVDQDLELFLNGYLRLVKDLWTGDTFPLGGCRDRFESMISIRGFVHGYLSFDRGYVTVNSSVQLLRNATYQSYNEGLNIIFKIPVQEIMEIKYFLEIPAQNMTGVLKMDTGYNEILLTIAVERQADNTCLYDFTGCSIGYASDVITEVIQGLQFDYQTAGMAKKVIVKFLKLKAQAMRNKILDTFDKIHKLIIEKAAEEFLSQKGYDLCVYK